MKNVQSIFGLDVVSINQRKTIGKVKDVIVDCIGEQYSHFVIESTDQSVILLLPFESAIGVGNDFVVAQDVKQEARNAESDQVAKKTLSEGFDLLQTQIATVQGDIVGSVSDIEIDEKTGSILNIVSEEENSYGIESVVFLSQEYVFINTKDDIAKKPDAKDTVDLDAETNEFLLGKTLETDVASDNGAFNVEAGTLVTEEIIEDAQKNNALVALTIAIKTDE